VADLSTLIVTIIAAVVTKGLSENGIVVRSSRCVYARACDLTLHDSHDGV
jgi:hypothetical protein